MNGSSATLTSDPLPEKTAEKFEDQAPRKSASLSVVVPVYKSEQGLPHLIQRLEPVLASVAKEYEVVLVDDGSPDGSWGAIQRLSEEKKWVRGIALMRNYGQHNALLCGIRQARCDIIITMDDDLQHPPEELPRLVAELESGYDVVYGAPQHEQHGFLRDMASVLTKMALQRSMGAKTARQVSALRIFRTHLRNAFADYHSPFVSIDVLLTWGTTRFSAIKVRHDERRAGTSNYTVFKLITHALNMVTGFSTMPLQFASILGFVCMLFGAGLLIFVLGRYFFSGTTVPGFTFLASSIAIFSGAQLFALGIVGEYLARMHFRMMERPTYAIRSGTHC